MRWLVGYDSLIHQCAFWPRTTGNFFHAIPLDVSSRAPLSALLQLTILCCDIWWRGERFQNPQDEERLLVIQILYEGLPVALACPDLMKCFADTPSICF